MKKFVVVLLTLALILTSFVGCSNSNDNSSKEEKNNEKNTAQNNPSSEKENNTGSEPVEGGVLKVALASSPKNLDPKFRTSAYESTIIDQVLDSLIIYNNEQSEFLPSLAKKWEVSDDGLVYTFYLRDDVYFQKGQYQDGRKFNADDVKYSLERAKEARNVTLVMLDHVEVVDEFTVKCILNAPNAIFMDALTGPTNMIVPKEEVEGWGEDFGKHLVGTGPFKLKEFVLDEKTTLERNENYWGEKPYLDGVEFKVISDTTQSVNGLKTGVVDLVLKVSGEGLQLIKSDDNLQLLSKPNTSINFIGFNTQDEVLKNIKVRQALCMAVDSKTLAQGIYQNGEAEPTCQPMPSASWGYDSSMEDMGYEYNPEKAKKILAEAGYPDGLTLTITMSNSTNNTRLATILQQIWKDTLNVDLKIDSSEWAVFSQTVTSGKHQMYTVGVSSTVDPHNFTGKCLGSQYVGTIPAGARLENDEIDTLVKKSLETSDIAKRKEVYKELVKKAMELYPAIYYSNDNIMWGASKKVHGLEQKTYWFLCNSECNVWMEK